MACFLERFFQRATHSPMAPCWRYYDPRTNAWCAIDWKSATDAVWRVSAWFVARGFPVGGRVALWAHTRVEWTIADFAVLAAGGVTVPVYHSLPLDQAEFIINEPKCCVLCVDTLDAERLAAIRAASPHVTDIVLLTLDVTPTGLPGVTTLGQILADTSLTMTDAVARCFARRDDDLATIVYTSGTTGQPKGVELTLTNFRAEVEGLTQTFHFPTGSECLMFLPLAHIVARAMQFFQAMEGHVGAYARSLDTIGEDMLAIRPHFFVGVPRIFEKMQSKMLAATARGSAMQRWLVHRTLALGEECSRYAQRGEALPLALRLQQPLARFMARKVRARFGGRLLVGVCGGAPLTAEVARFFYSLGLLILEGYGLTETTAAITLNRANAFHFGTVGKPLSGVQLRFAEDGEILVKGAVVFQRYFERPDDTRAVFDDGGWFHTGDIGALSKEGFLRITDRKKDLLKTSGGKYIAPQPLENLLKQIPLVSDALVIGDGRKYITTLIALDRDAAARLVHADAAIDLAALTQDPRVIAAVQLGIDAINHDLASYESIKYFRILPTELSVADGALTPTLKLKRKVVCAQFAALIASMYDDALTGASHVA